VPSFHELLLYAVAIIVLAILMRIEVLLARDFGATRVNVFEPEKLLEYRLCGALYFVHWLIDGSAIAIPVMIINAFGGGIIHLSSDGWWYVPSFLFYLIVFDLYVYSVHVASHKVPFLWSMHSLHHSATAMSTTTGGRHFWGESVVGAVLFAPVMGLLLHVPDNIILPVTFINFFVGATSHFNVPVRFGKFAVIFNNPQWHRVHHSRLPQHRDKNFANFFPAFDLLFGTAWIPAADEFPDAGLDTGDKPRTVFEGMIWPVRHVWRRLGAGGAPLHTLPKGGSVGS
jgi:sterol desaturase/sphingolipid hydroxylase (fatty acid hydroxylase superfamily)